MKLSKLILTLLFVSTLALIYIHMQMKIFDLAYQGKIKENQITTLAEMNGMVAYHMLRLKSSSHLGIQLIEEDAKLRFRDHRNVVQLVTAESAPAQEATFTSYQTKTTHPLWSFLTLRSPAEAQANEKSGSSRPKDY